MSIVIVDSPEQVGAPELRLRRTQRAKVVFSIIKARLREWLIFDSFIARSALALTGLMVCALAAAGVITRSGLRFLERVHRSAHSRICNRAIEATLASASRSKRGRKRLHAIYEQHIEQSDRDPRLASFVDDPLRLLGSQVMVLKSSRPDERGVIMMGYSSIFPLFLKLFDFEQIASRYFFLIKPSWSGYCTLDVLCWCRFEFPIFVGTIEPVEEAFVRNIRVNLLPVPLASNGCIDYRVFRPLDGVEKEIDVIMVASWASFKRHDRFFEALRTLRRQGHILRATLIGYPADRTVDQIRDLAQYYGVLDQLELHEWLKPDEVNHHYNRAKVNLVWSRMEGVNRAIIEGMFANVPCILREGFNYGHQYAYVRPETGCYASDLELPQTLLRMVREYQRFSPREWLLGNWSCEHSARVLSQDMRRAALSLGENWTRDLAPQVSSLHAMRYWHADDQASFDDDYEFLRSTLRTN
jgi:glycosyltransferase involved in cell wall biosynthesis